MTESHKLLRHVVLFRFKAEATQAQLREVEETFRALPEQIDAIHELEWGADVSVEGLAKGYTHCMLVTFKREADRDAYLPHVAHQDAAALAGQYVEQVLVIDYWAGE